MSSLAGAVAASGDINHAVADIKLDHKDSKSLHTSLLTFTHDKLCMEESYFDCIDYTIHLPVLMECSSLHEQDSSCRDVTKVDDCQFQQLPIVITCFCYRQQLFCKTL